MDCEITGTLEVGQWGTLADNAHIGLLTPTNNPRRYRITIKPKAKKPTGKVRVRYSRKLTEQAQSGLMHARPEKDRQKTVKASQEE